MKGHTWMIGTPLPVSGLQSHQRVICTAEVDSTVIAIVEADHAGLVASAPKYVAALEREGTR